MKDLANHWSSFNFTTKIEVKGDFPHLPLQQVSS